MIQHSRDTEGGLGSGLAWPSEGVTGRYANLVKDPKWLADILAIESLGVCLCRQESDGSLRLLVCNDKYEEMIGRSRHELRRVRDLRTLSRALTHSGDCRAWCEQGLPVTGVAAWRRPDGSECYYEYSAVQFGRRGRRYLIGVDEDITESWSRIEAMKRQRVHLALDRQRWRRDLAESLNARLAGRASELRGQTRQALEALIDGRAEPARQRMARLTETFDGLADAARRLCQQLFPPTLEALGLVAALEQWVFDRGARDVVEVRCENLDPNVRLGEEIEAGVFRLAEEALVAALEQGDPGCIDVVLRRTGGHVELEVKDEREDVGADAWFGPGEFGVAAEPIRALGGEVSVRSDSGGTSVLARLPDAPAPPTEMPGIWDGEDLELVAGRGPLPELVEIQSSPPPLQEGAGLSTAECRELARRFVDQDPALADALAIEGIGVAVVLRGPGNENHRVLACNQTHARTRGMSREDLLDLANFWPSVRVLICNPSLPRLWASGLPTSGVSVWLGPGGERTHFSWTMVEVWRQGDLQVQFLVDRDMTSTLREIREMRLARQRLALAGQRDRRRLAGQLHDLVGQQSIAMRLILERCLMELGSDNSAGRTTIEGLDRLFAEMEQRIAALSGELYPLEVVQEGLAAACRQLVQQYPGRVRLRLCNRFAERRVDPPIAALLYQGVHAAVENALVHGQAGQVRVDLAYTEKRQTAKIKVVDDGRGFESARVFGAGLTLARLRESAVDLGGRLSLRREQGRTVFRMEAPAACAGESTTEPSPADAASGPARA